GQFAGGDPPAVDVGDLPPRRRRSFPHDHILQGRYRPVTAQQCRIRQYRAIHYLHASPSGLHQPARRGPPALALLVGPEGNRGFHWCAARWDHTAGPISADSPALLDEAIAEHDKKENP